MSSSSECVVNVVPFQFPVIGSDVAPTSLPWESATAGAPAEDVDERMAKSRIEGRSEGERLARECFEQDLREIRAAVAVAIHEFTSRREAHLREMEVEAVKLALSIARRVLNREAQIDPELLRALVRSCLTELGDTSAVRLFVHPAYVDEWHAYFAQEQPRQHPPEIVADRHLPRHECRLESSIGSTSISMESRFAEIEKGLFDQLSQSLEQRVPTGSSKVQ